MKVARTVLRGERGSNAPNLLDYMINSKWGVMKNASSSNGCRILKYEGMDDNKTPIFSMYKINGEYPTETYSYNRIYTECWKMQVGIRYIFN